MHALAKVIVMTPIKIVALMYDNHGISSHRASNLPLTQDFYRFEQYPSGTFNLAKV